MRNSMRIPYLILCLVVSACSGPSRDSAMLSIPKGGWNHATERPYRDRGNLYIPQQHYAYYAEGYATWYGPECHGLPTAMGHRFNMNTVSAAHRTLPLPCVVRVTNLENGRQMKILVNDRGPFLDIRRRLIDISRRGAQLLGYYDKGKARVRIECLPEESYKIALLCKRKPYPLLPEQYERRGFPEATMQRKRIYISKGHSLLAAERQKNCKKLSQRSLDALVESSS